jgi:hypothetical protein
MSRNSLPIPTEAQEQIALFEWAQLQSGKHPELSLLYHIPNGGSRHPAEARNLKAQGVKAGVPDICLPVPRGGCHALYIELKRYKGSVVSPEQTDWMNALKDQGYAVALCYGWEVAVEVILGYLETRE